MTHHVTMLAPHPRSTAAELMRLLAVWLAAIVLVQGVAAAQALGFGPLHRHTAAALHDDHHHHDGAQRHHHAASDGSMLAVAAAEPAFDAAAFALVAALALMALGHWRFNAQAQRRSCALHRPGPAAASSLHCC